jgi:hypothetical protein
MQRTLPQRYYCQAHFLSSAATQGTCNGDPNPQSDTTHNCLLGDEMKGPPLPTYEQGSYEHEQQPWLCSREQNIRTAKRMC